MTAQEAAFRVLRQSGRPLSSKEIAKRALAQGLLRSNARSPIDSIAQTIEKNVRDGVYNHPELEFVPSVNGRLVGIPGAKRKSDEPVTTSPPKVNGHASGRIAIIPEDEVWSVALPARLVNKLDLCVMLGMGGSREAVAAEMLRRGLENSNEEIMSALRDQMADAKRDGTQTRGDFLSNRDDG